MLVGSEPAPQSLSHTVSDMYLDFGSTLDQIPDGSNNIQGDTIYFQQELHRDCIYQVNYEVIVNTGNISQRIGIEVETGSWANAYHEKVLYVGGGSDQPAVSMGDSFLVRIPKGNVGASYRFIQFKIGHAVTGTLGNWNFGTGVSGQTIYVGKVFLTLVKVN